MKNQKRRGILSFITPMIIMFSLIIFTVAKAYTKEDELTIVFTNKITEEGKTTASNEHQTIDYTDTVTEQPVNKEAFTSSYAQLDINETETNNTANIAYTTDNLLEPSNITAEQLENIFSSFEYSQNMVPLASLFVETEHLYGINAIILSSIASWESDLPDYFWSEGISSISSTYLRALEN